jgi:hypothetical protein
MRTATATLVTGLVSAALQAMTSPPASAEPLGASCTGIEVRRCLSLVYDPATASLQSRSSSRDTDGGGAYAVATNYVTLEVRVGDQWVVQRRANDTDGWHDVSDAEATGWEDVGCDLTYRVNAHFTWRWWANGSLHEDGQWRSLSRTIRC